VECRLGPATSLEPSHGIDDMPGGALPSPHGGGVGFWFWLVVVALVIVCIGGESYYTLVRTPQNMETNSPNSPQASPNITTSTDDLNIEMTELGRRTN
ncbi:hypothetical protein MKX03_027096, partial [Papaver bracteatum]